MKVLLRVLGDQLPGRVASEIARRDTAFPRHSGSGALLHWQIERLSSPLTSACLDNTPTRPAIVLIEAHDAAVVDQLWSLHSRDYHAICRSDRLDDPPAPVIIVFDRELPTTHLPEMPGIVTDWVTGSGAMQDLARRVIAALKRQQQLIEPGGSGLALAAGSRHLCHAGQSILLTPSEVAVAELFLARFGSVIPLDELQLLFKLAGRSTEGSNMRVTMFQLRFKIEALTRCHYTLTSAYGQGYVLRHGKGGDAAPGPGWPQRQAVASPLPAAR